MATGPEAEDTPRAVLLLLLFLPPYALVLLVAAAARLNVRVICGVVLVQRPRAPSPAPRAARSSAVWARAAPQRLGRKDARARKMDAPRKY